MLGGILVLIASGAVSFAIIDSLKNRYAFIDARLLKNLFFFHCLLLAAYYGYVLFNSSDSQYYYIKVETNLRGDTWGDYYGTSTTFIEFIGYPFIKYLNFSYEAIMALFSFFGFLGFVYFYIFFRENIRFPHTLFGFDLIKVFLFLPNLHFWSTSFGKGSIIFLGIGLFFFAMSKLRSRWIAFVIAGFLIYHVRPHIMLVIMASAAIGFMFSTKGISIALRLVFLAGILVTFFYIYSDVLEMMKLNEEEIITQGVDLSNRARELTKATSGIDIASYSLPMQIFTFLYRPLFVDAPGVLGLIVSFENVFYLLITLRLLSFKGINFLITSNFMVKTAFVSFLTVTFALAQISGNLGLAIRQKSQVMLLFLFVIISFLDDQKAKSYRAAVIRRIRKERNEKLSPQRAI